MIMNSEQMDVGQMCVKEFSNVSKQSEEKTMPVRIAVLYIFQTFHLTILSKEQ